MSVHPHILPDPRTTFSAVHCSQQSGCDLFFKGFAGFIRIAGLSLWIVARNLSFLCRVYQSLSLSRISDHKSASRRISFHPRSEVLISSHGLTALASSGVNAQGIWHFFAHKLSDSRISDHKFASRRISAHSRSKALIFSHNLTALALICFFARTDIFNRLSYASRSAARAVDVQSSRLLPSSRSALLGPVCSTPDALK